LVNACQSGENVLALVSLIVLSFFPHECISCAILAMGQDTPHVKLALNTMYTLAMSCCNSLNYIVDLCPHSVEILVVVVSCLFLVGSNTYIAV